MQKTIFSLAVVALFAACQPALDKKEERTPEFVTTYFVNKSGKKEGILTKTDAKTQAIVQESMYKDDLQEGEEKMFFPSGKVEELRHYKAGKPDGTAQTFYESGVLRSDVTFVNGAMQGLYKKYYENKQVKESVTFVDNVENGAFEEFYENGKPKTKGSYKFNVQFDQAMEEGELVLYDSLGVVTKKMCSNGRCTTL